MASAISIIPRLIPCSSSPAPANINNRKKSTIECTAISDCPTPTVSIKMVSNPAASHKIMVSLVFLATPPNEPAVGEGRINALGSAASFSILVLSPIILPLERALLGSMAKTASFLSNPVTYVPSASINVLLPTPGTPVIPTRTDFPQRGRHCSIISWAITWWSDKELSISVIAWLKMILFPSKIP
ncbi:hypothetical protein ES708_06662 [subsurface metagenome]